MGMWLLLVFRDYSLCHGFYEVQMFQETVMCEIDVFRKIPALDIA